MYETTYIENTLLDSDDSTISTMSIQYDEITMRFRIEKNQDWTCCSLATI